MELVKQLFPSVWSDALIWFGGLWAVVLFIRKVSKNADDELEPTKRQVLGERLTQMRHQSSGAWIPDFTDVFDRFFGRKHLTLRCFCRSSLISIFCFSVLIIMARLNPGKGLEAFLAPFVLGFIFNAVVDYLSLLETRTLLSTQIPTFLKIVIDTILTFIITLLWVSLVNWLMDGAVLDDLLMKVNDSWQSFLGRATNKENIIAARIIVGTGFTTSIWLWLHGIAQLTIRNLKAFTSLMGWLNVAEKPLRAIGTTINVFVVFFGIVLFPLYLLIAR